jgi:hypothetical protein
MKRTPRGPDLRPRLKPGHVRCSHCGEELLETLAVGFNGDRLHPLNCFPAVLAKKIATIRNALDGVVAATADLFTGKEP